MQSWKTSLVSTSRLASIREYFLVSLRVDYLLELQLLLLTFSTGIQDAISFPDFHCFASNQTGNTVVPAVGLAGQAGDLFSLSNVGLSLGMFVAGAVSTGQIGHFVGPRRRAWLLFTHLIQTIMAGSAAAIQALSPLSSASTLSSLGLLAFSSGAQVASMRPFCIQEITTAMATAAWIDLVIDPRLLAIRNHPRDRRAGFLVALVAGSFAGAFLQKGVGTSNALVVSAVGKLLVFLILFINKEETEQSTC